MNYFVRFNQSASEMFEIRAFQERIQTKRRNLTLNLSISNPEDGDATIASLAKFLEEGAIVKIEVLNANEVVVYSSNLYNEVSSFNIELNFNYGESGDYRQSEMNYTLNFVAEE